MRKRPHKGFSALQSQGILALGVSSTEPAWSSTGSASPSTDRASCLWIRGLLAGPARDLVGGPRGRLRGSVRGESSTLPDVPDPGRGEALPHDHSRFPHEEVRQFTAVDDVTFTAIPGRVTGFLGPNGAGKSTTMRVMVGLTPPTSGEVTISGRRLRRPAQPRARGRRPAGRLGAARRPHRPGDPHHRPAHDGPAQARGSRRCSTGSA